MAKRKLSAKQIAAGFGGKRRKSSTGKRRMNGVRASSRKRRRARMNAVSVRGVQGAVMDGVQIGGGILLGMLAAGAAKRFIANPYGRAAAVGGAGVLLALLMPQASKVAGGVVGGAIASGAVNALQGTKIGQTLNGVKRLSMPELKKLADDIRKAGKGSRAVNGQPDTLNGQPDTLNGAWSSLYA